jgi:hypothetical protein
MRQPTRTIPRKPNTPKSRAEWLVHLLECGLLKGSFIPPADIKAARDVIWYRTKVMQSRTSEVQRLGNVLQDSGIKIDSVTSITAKSGREMIEALIDGERRPRVLADLAKGRMRPKIPDLAMALEARDELVQDCPQVPRPTISIRSVTSNRAVRAHLSASPFARGLRGGIFATSIPAPAKHRVPNASVNCLTRSPIRNRNPAARSPRFHHQVPGLLHRPRPVRVRGHARTWTWPVPTSITKNTQTRRKVTALVCGS